MRRRLFAFPLTVFSTLLLLVAAGHWWSVACFPMEVHTVKWECELGLPLLGLSFAVPTLFYGLTVARSPWLEGFSLSIVASAIAGIMSYFDPFFSGGSPLTNATAALHYAVLPGLVGMLAGFSLQPHVGHRAGA